METDKELTAMTAIVKELDKFSADEKPVVERILGWVALKYEVKPVMLHAPPDKPRGGSDGDDGELEDIADLYDAANPKTDAKRALIAGYWLSVGEGKTEFTGQAANTHLKNLGHGVSNITVALSQLKGQKPSLVMQTAKSGKSKQARKKYKLTTAGVSEVKAMLSASS